MGAARLVARRAPNLCAEGLISSAAAKFKRCVFTFILITKGCLM